MNFDSLVRVSLRTRKDSLRLLFWSGQSFHSPGLAKEGSFRGAEACDTSVVDIDAKLLAKWLAESRDTQWDCNNIGRRTGKLERLK